MYQQHCRGLVSTELTQVYILSDFTKALDLFTYHDDTTAFGLCVADTHFFWTYILCYNDYERKRALLTCQIGILIYVLSHEGITKRGGSRERTRI